MLRTVRTKLKILESFPRETLRHVYKLTISRVVQLSLSPGLPLRLLDPVERSPEFGFLVRLSFPCRAFGRGGVGLGGIACRRRTLLSCVRLPPVVVDAGAHPVCDARGPG